MRLGWRDCVFLKQLHLEAEQQLNPQCISVEIKCLFVPHLLCFLFASDVFVSLPPFFSGYSLFCFFFKLSGLF